MTIRIPNNPKDAFSAGFNFTRNEIVKIIDANLKETQKNEASESDEEFWSGYIEACEDIRTAIINLKGGDMG